MYVCFIVTEATRRRRRLKMPPKRSWMEIFQMASTSFISGLGLTSLIQVFYSLGSYVMNPSDSIIIYSVALGISVILLIWNMGHIQSRGVWYMAVIWFITMLCFIGALYYAVMLKKDEPVSVEHRVASVFTSCLFAFGAGTIHIIYSIETSVMGGGAAYRSMNM